MKKLLFVFLFLALALGAVIAQEPVYYNSHPTVAWTPTATRPDLQPLATGDTIEYRVYAWDVNNGDMMSQPLSSLDLRATWVDEDPFTIQFDQAKGIEGIQIDFAYTATNGWGVALVATHIDGGGNRTDYAEADTLYSLVAEDTASGVPFVYFLGSAEAVPGAGPTGLQDSGM